MKLTLKSFGYIAAIAAFFYIVFNPIVEGFTLNFIAATCIALIIISALSLIYNLCGVIADRFYTGDTYEAVYRTYEYVIPLSDNKILNPLTENKFQFLYYNPSGVILSEYIDCYNDQLENIEVKDSETDYNYIKKISYEYVNPFFVFFCAPPEECNYIIYRVASY